MNAAVSAHTDWKVGLEPRGGRGGKKNKKNLQCLQRDRTYQPESLNYPVYREKQQSRTAAQTCCLGFLRDADRNKSEASGAAVSNPNLTCTALAAQ